MSPHPRTSDHSIEALQRQIHEMQGDLAATMKSRARDHFQDLPVELIESIAVYLPSDDLFNLRLASTSLAAKTAEYIIRTYYRDLHVLMMDAHCMRRLWQISRYPVYRDAVRSIRFNVSTVKGKGSEYKVQTSRGAISLLSIRSTTYTAHEEALNRTKSHGLGEIVLILSNSLSLAHFLRYILSKTLLTLSFFTFR